MTIEGFVMRVLPSSCNHGYRRFRITRDDLMHLGYPTFDLDPTVLVDLILHSLLVVPSEQS